jgi:hypothetical protein
MLIAQNVQIFVMIAFIMKSLEKFSAINAEKDSYLIVTKKNAIQSLLVRQGSSKLKNWQKIRF